MTTDPTKSLPDGEITQSAQLLQENFGCELDDVVIEQDPFYAFHQLFMFTAFSEIQFLNLMEAQLRKILKNLDNPAFERLNHHRIILSDHCWQLQETLAVIRRRGPPSKWPIAESSVIKLEINFHHLYSRATHLINEYTYAIAQYSYKPAQPQTQQAPQIQRPVVNTTVLCFIIIPLAISCFFSMNFKELQALSIWIYFVIAVPSSLITFGCLWFGGWILSKERRQNILRLFRPLNLVPEDLEKQRP